MKIREDEFSGSIAKIVTSARILGKWKEFKLKGIYLGTSNKLLSRMPTFKLVNPPIVFRFKRYMFGFECWWTLEDQEKHKLLVEDIHKRGFNEEDKKAIEKLNNMLYFEILKNKDDIK